jgi:hypothetical protein
VRVDDKHEKRASFWKFQTTLSKAPAPIAIAPLLYRFVEEMRVTATKVGWLKLRLKFWHFDPVQSKQGLTYIPSRQIRL